MPKESLPAALRAVGVTPVTPFTDDLHSVDRAGLRSNLEFLASAEVSLLYPCGNTGEFNSLSVSEWRTVVETSTAAAGAELTVIPGVGHGLADAKQMLAQVEELEVDGVLCMPPHPTFVSKEGLRAYYLHLVDASPVPVVLYKRAGLPPDDLLSELVKMDEVVGVKYGDPDVSAFGSLAAGGGAVWTCGLAELWAPFFHLAGAEGFTSGLANFAPDVALALFDALAAGDQETAMKIRSTCHQFEEIRARDASANNVAAVKTAMDSLSLAGGRVRPPLRDLDGRTAEEVRLAISEWS